MQNMNSTASSQALLNELELQRLTQALQGLDKIQLAWAGGYIAGLTVPPVSGQTTSTKLTILFASQTGNARSVAQQLAKQVASQGLAYRLKSVADYRPRDLSKEQYLIYVTSTQGEGEPPETALDFYRFISHKRAPRLANLNYAVFGLGDSSYAHFCQAAVEVDERLAALGAKRIQTRTDADVDFQADAEQWLPNTVTLLAELLPTQAADIVPIRPLTVNQADRQHPYTAEVLDNRRITTLNAPRDVHHIALAVDPSKLAYQPGDALAIVHHNEPALVEEILHLTGIPGNVEIEYKNKRISISQVLQEHLEISQLHPTVVKNWADLSNSQALQSLAEDSTLKRLFSNQRQFIDLLREYPVHIDAATLATTLLPLQPRLYSIASSQAEYDNEVHISVATHQHHAFGNNHLGSASGFLNQRLNEDDKVSVYVVENTSFRLPENTDTPIIMIGAGTGIAPYRAFLQHRAANNHQGDNWLFFGNRHFRHDFLYQTDWLAWRKSGLLNRISTSFSRDKLNQGYIQQRLLQQAKTVYQQLEQGAHIYVCGAIAMEAEVRQAVEEVVGHQANISPEKAFEFVENLRSKGRYQRDVY